MVPSSAESRRRYEVARSGYAGGVSAQPFERDALGLVADQPVLCGEIGPFSQAPGEPGATGRVADDQQGGAALGRCEATVAEESHLPAGTVCAVSPNFRDAGATAGGVRHGERLAMVDRLLAIRARRGFDYGGRSGVTGFFVWAFYRFLERARGHRSSWRDGHPGGWDEHAGTARFDQSQRGHSPFLYANLCLAYGRSGGSTQCESGQFRGADDRRGRRAGRFGAGNAAADRSGLECAGDRS